MRIGLPVLFVTATMVGAAISHSTVAAADMPQTYRSSVPDRADDFADGYRWARLVQVSDATQCPEDSWAFTRGCRAFLLSAEAGG